MVPVSPNTYDRAKGEGVRNAVAAEVNHKDTKNTKERKGESVL